MYSRVFSQIERINTPKCRKALEEFVKILFNNRAKGNNMLMLGVDNRSLIQEMLGGLSAQATIKEEAKYNIHIIRTIKDCKIVVSFRHYDCINDKTKEYVRDLFEIYNKDIDLNLALKNGQIPSLPITGQNEVQQFLESPRECFRILSGNELIDSLDISYPSTNDEPVHNSINDLWIITKENEFIARSKGNEEEGNGASSFWNQVVASGKNIYNYNFVILNNIDDYLIKAFNELRSLYREKLCLDDSDVNLLNRVFMLSDNRYYETRSELPCNLLQDINAIQDDARNAAMYSCLIERINKLCFADISKIRLYVDEYKKSMERLRTNVVKFSKLAGDLRQIPDKYNNLLSEKSSVCKLRDDKNDDRDKTIDTIDKSQVVLSKFVSEYCDSMPQVEDLTEQIKNGQEYLKKKKTLFVSSYVKGKEDFKNFVSNYCRDYIKIVDNIQNEITCPIHDDIEKIKAKCEVCFCETLDSVFSPLLNISAKLYNEHGRNKGKFMSVVNHLIDQKLNFDGIMDGTVASMLDEAYSKVDSIISLQETSKVLDVLEEEQVYREIVQILQDEIKKTIL